MSRRLGASVAILGGAVSLVLAAYVFVVNFPAGLIVLGCVGGALAAAWLGLLRHGATRLLATAVAAILLAVAIATFLAGESGLVFGGVLIGFLVGVGGARVAFRPQRSLPRAGPPLRPVLFVNPRSGDGKAGEVGVMAAAQQRGIEALELGAGDDLEQLVRAAVQRGADGLAMAGGDGSQALVAAIAAEHDLPYACIPSGTRNHFALDLGVDREDVVGALDAFVDGGERYVDLGEVNGRVFVNNVSLGVYAEAVDQEGYREAKLRTLLETLSDSLSPEAEPPRLRWLDPDGTERCSTALVLISNNVYRLGATLGSGTRPRLDQGVLGVLDFHPPAAGRPQDAARWRELATPELAVDSDQSSLAVGIDGESTQLQPPLHFRIRPRALRVRIAREHPGASPSANVPRGPLSALKALLRLAAGSPRSSDPTHDNGGYVN
jgi:diacylglycerol kinase family enzyme